MRARAAASLLVPALVALAGCLGGGSGGGGDGEVIPSTGPVATASSTGSTTSTPPQSLVVELLPDFAFETCRGLSVQAARPVAEVQALLPEGFTAAPAFGSEGFGLVGLDIYACGNLTTPNTRIADTVYGQVYTHVLKPADRVPGAPDADVHEYAFRLLARDDVLARLWPTAGYETRNGTAVVAVGPVSDGIPVDPGLRLGNASVGPDYRLLASGSPPTTAIPASGTFARYTVLGVDGSVLVWTGAYAFPDFFAGSGTLAVAADDPFASFEVADTGNIEGLARLYESGAIVDQDLRRYF